MKNVLFILCLTVCTARLHAEDGYRLWLRYDLVRNNERLVQYRDAISGVQVLGKSPTLAAAKNELQNGLTGLLGRKPLFQNTIQNGTLVIETLQASARIASLIPNVQKAAAGSEGFIIRTVQQYGKHFTIITANSDVGVLYGVFHFLRLLQTERPIRQLLIITAPKIQHRILNHWDNLNRTVERGYAGMSIWNWHTLPDYIDQRYIDYARANASIGINGTVLTNVNANALVLTKDYLVKVGRRLQIPSVHMASGYISRRASVRLWRSAV